ncbi:MAG: hypothetical protein ACTTGJ_00235 [Clostridium sp.]
MSKLVSILLTASIISSPYITRDNANHIKDINEMVSTNGVSTSRLERMQIDIQKTNDGKTSYLENILNKWKLENYILNIRKSMQNLQNNQENNQNNTQSTVNNEENIKRQKFNFKYLKYIGNKNKDEVISLLQELKNSNNNTSYNIQKQENPDIPKILIQFKDIIIEPNFDDKKYELYISQAIKEVEDKTYTVGVLEKQGYISEIYIFEVNSIKKSDR